MTKGDTSKRLRTNIILIGKKAIADCELSKPSRDGSQMNWNDKKSDPKAFVGVLRWDERNESQGHSKPFKFKLAYLRNFVTCDLSHYISSVAE